MGDGKKKKYLGRVFYLLGVWGAGWFKYGCEETGKKKKSGGFSREGQRAQKIIVTWVSAVLKGEVHHIFQGQMGRGS